MIYLASPYSHPDSEVRERNFRHVAAIAARMVADGEIVISPIVYGHTLISFHEMPGSWEFWQKFCSNILYKCEKLVVCTMEGWEDSRGIADEISIARDHGIPVEYMRPVLGHCESCSSEITVYDSQEESLYKCPSCGALSSSQEL